MAKKKYYVVCNGIKPGICESSNENWNECQHNIKGYPDTKHKSFTTKFEAKTAFSGNYHNYTNKQTTITIKLEGLKNDQPKPVYPALAVDAACNTATGDMEYRSVDTKTEREIFRQGPHFDGTNNVDKFLAIIHVLALLKQKGSNLPIIHQLKSSRELGSTETGQNQAKKTNRNQIVFDLMVRAEKWLRENRWTTKLLKLGNANLGRNTGRFWKEIKFIKFAQQ